MSAKVRRGTYRRRCARCFWEGTYDTSGKANYAKRKHSCTKREDAMIRAAMREAREALIDRTPKPCLHKIANHQHGQRATYVLDACRCLPCSKANSEAETWRERQKLYDRYNKYVPAEFVRDHLRELMAYGIGLKQVTRLTGINGGQMNKIMYGSASRVDKGPSVRVTRATAERIYAVEPIPTNLAPGAQDPHRTPTARLQLRALVALGWSMSELGRRLGIAHGGNACITIAGDRTLTRGTVDKAEALYAALSMTLPPATNQRERISVSRSCSYAKAHGWLPPLALEDIGDVELTDDDYLDEAAMERRLAGDRTVRLHKGESAEVVRRALARGMNTGQIERLLGIKPERYVRLSDQAAS
jgi:hypothetical protein